jgi:MEMO1 family protein
MAGPVPHYRRKPAARAASAGSRIASMSVPLIRPAAVAGSWYPGSRGALEREVDGLLAAAEVPPLPEVLAVISPHAGMMFSGGVAAHAYRALGGRDVDVVVLVGPSHFVGFDGVAIYERGGFETPLGVAEIDEPTAAALMAASPLIRPHPAAHAREHSLEMQLPFVQRLLSARIVPLALGYQTRKTILALAEALPRALEGRRALMVASTDLSHYFEASRAETLDGLVSRFVGDFDPEGLLDEFESYPEHERGRYVACGGGAAIAVMMAARTRGAHAARVLRYAHSGDVSGDRSTVVGYLAAAMVT